MIIVSTTGAGEAQAAIDLFRTAPRHLDWKVFEMGALVASSADGRTWTGPDRVIRQERLHPAYERMRQLLIEHGKDGYGSWKLWDQLRDEGLDVARETVHRWLHSDERKGLVRRYGNGWIWAGEAR